MDGVGRYHDADGAVELGGYRCGREAGVGVRWVSPVGPIRFDIAHPFDIDDAFRVHFSIGPEF